MRHVRLHLRQFRASGRLDALDPRLVLHPGVRRPSKSTAIARDRAIDLQQLERLLDAADPEIDGLLELRLRHRVDRLQRRQDLVHVHGRRECRIHEVRGDRVVLAPTQKHPIGMLDSATGATDLLVVRDRRAGPLVVDHEAEIWLVEPHAEGHRRDQCLDLARTEGVFELFALLGGEVRVVGVRIDPLAPQERGDALSVRHGQAVDDAAAEELRKLAGEPGESFRLVVERDRIESKRIASQGSAKDLDSGAELVDDIGDDPIVGGCGRGQDRDAWGEESKDARDAPVVGAEVVTPVGDAVRLVHHEQTDRAPDAGQDIGREALVREAFRGDEEDVDGVRGQTVGDRVPLVRVARVDRRRAEAQPFRHRDLVPHERKQRADDQRGSVALIAPDARGDPVDQALAPARPLHDQRAMAVLGDGFDGLALTVAERCVRTEHRMEVARKDIHRPQCDRPGVAGPWRGPWRAGRGGRAQAQAQAQNPGPRLVRSGKPRPRPKTSTTDWYAAPDASR